MRAFVAVATHRGFASAARALRMSASSLTRRMDALEEHLGVKLLVRTTRRVDLTEAGHRFLADSVRILDDVTAATRETSESEGDPRGVLRVAAPPSIGHALLPTIMRSFLAEYNEVTLDLTLTDRVVNLMEGAIDVALRVGVPGDSPDLVVRILAPMRRIACASPAYIGAAGPPMTPADLTSFSCLLFRPAPAEDAWKPRRAIWHFRRDEQRQEIALVGRIASNNADSLVGAARAGLGIVLMPDWLVAEDLSSGRLVQVLADYDAGPFDDEKCLHLAYLPHRRHALKVRRFCSHVESSLKDLSTAAIGRGSAKTRVHE